MDETRRDTHSPARSLTLTRHPQTRKDIPMTATFTIGHIIDQRASRLYTTTRAGCEVGLYQTGLLQRTYYVTKNRIVVGVFTDRDEADRNLAEIIDDLEAKSLQGLEDSPSYCCKVSETF